MGVGRSCLATR